MALLAGQIWGFRARDLFFADGPVSPRFGAMRVLGPGQPGWACVAVLDGIFRDWPQSDALQGLGVLLQSRFALSDVRAVQFVQNRPPNEQFRLLGHAALPPEAGPLLAGCRSYALIETLPRMVEGEWRWRYDRAALLSDHLRWQEAEAERRQCGRAYRRRRLKGLTLSLLASEVPLAAWPERFGVVPPAYAAAAQGRLRQAIAALLALGNTPPRTAVQTVLHDAILWFNAAEGSCGYNIDPEERDDLLAALFEMAHAAGHPGLAAEFDDWRTW